MELSGSCVTQNAGLYGSGDIHLFGSESDTTNINVYGSGDADIDVTEIPRIFRNMYMVLEVPVSEKFKN